MTQPEQERDPSVDVGRWIEQAHGGSEEALGRLLEACRPYLLLVANRHLNPAFRCSLGPSDLVQETFVRAHRGFGGFQGRTEEQLLGWLRRILHNALADTVRRESRRVRHPKDAGPEGILGALVPDVPDPAPSPSADAIAQEQAGELERALGLLPDLYRQVIRWRVWEGKSFEEIGQFTDRSAEAARKLWARAVENLQRVLGPHEP